MAPKELFYRKRWLVMRYNVENMLMHGPKVIQTPNMQKYSGSLTSRLLFHTYHMSGSGAEKPYWARTFLVGQKRASFMMANVGGGRQHSWNHSWQRYRVSDGESGHEQFLDLRGPQPR